MPLFVFALIIGVLFAWLGADLFVRGSVNLSRWIGISTRIIGLTIAAFATSSPEFSVAVTASLSGNNAISLGDALGSNVVNIMLILGLALLIKPMSVKNKQITADYFWAAIAPVIIGILCWDGSISRWDGAILLLAFFVWLTTTIRIALKERASRQRIKISIWEAIFFLGAGIIFLILAGKLIVYGASNIALLLGVQPFIIGATIVAVATGTPEIATTLIARIKGQDDLSLGTILGSNIFNALFIIAIAAMIMPIQIKIHSIILPLVFGYLSIFLLLPKKNILNRTRGVVLFTLYLFYFWLTVSVK